MALRWDFKEKAGTITEKNGDVRNWYEGNALMIVLNEWEEKGSEFYSLYWSFFDKEHGKNCLGISKGHDNIFADQPIIELTINRRYCHYWKDIITMFTKAFPEIKIVLYDEV